MRLKIAVLSRNFSTTGGGAEHYSIAVVEQLAKHHEVHVFAQTFAHAWPGLHYHAIGRFLQRPRWINQWWFAMATWWATRKGFDIVHSHENVWHGNVQTVHVLQVRHSLFHGKTGLAWWLRCIKVASSPRLLSYLWLEKQRYTVTPSRRVVVVSDALRTAMLEAYPGVAGALAVITPGVAVPALPTSAAQKQEARERLGLPTDGTCLLFVGNDFQKKGLPVLVNALARMEPGVCLAVVGNPKQADAIGQLARGCGVGERVHFLGALLQMDSAYRACDMLVHPTLQDSYGMVVLEAMAYGLPVVVSGLPYCGIAGDLTHQAQAWLLPNPHDVSALEHAIRSVLGNPVLAQSMAEKGLQFAHSHSWELAGQLHERLFEDLLAKGVDR